MAAEIPNSVEDFGLPLVEKFDLMSIEFVPNK